MSPTRRYGRACRVIQERRDASNSPSSRIALVHLVCQKSGVAGGSHPPMDNNQAERALRGPVVGRKNYYCSRAYRAEN